MRSWAWTSNYTSAVLCEQQQVTHPALSWPQAAQAVPIWTGTLLHQEHKGV